MPQSLAQLYVHIVFSTKNRMPYLSDSTIRERMIAYLIGILRNQDSPSIAIGAVADHIHALCRMSKRIAVSDLIREMKRDSSKWVKTEFPELSDFHWQSGFGAFSISASHVDLVTRYVRGQEEHHRTESFQDELRRLCREHGIEIDERYVWD